MVKYRGYFGRTKKIKTVGGVKKSVRWGRRVPKDKQIKRVVKKVLSRALEVKRGYVEPSSSGYNPQTTNSFSVLPNITQLNFYQLCPTIAQGTDDQSRTGNKITPKGLYVKGHISGDWLNIVANNCSFQTLYVRIMCVSDKVNPVDSLAHNAFNTGQNYLLQKGGTSTNFLFSDQTSLYRPINTDRFTKYYDKVIKIGMYSAVIGTANVDQNHGLHRFQFKVPMKEAWKFDDNQTRPTNVGMPFMLIGYCPGDNRNIVSGATTSFIKCSYYTDFYYTDA